MWYSTSRVQHSSSQTVPDRPDTGRPPPRRPPRGSPFRTQRELTATSFLAAEDQTAPIRSMPSMPRSDGSSVSQFCKSTPGEDVDLGLAAEGDHDVDRTEEFRVDGLGRLAGDVHAELGQDLGRQTIDLR